MAINVGAPAPCSIIYTSMEYVFKIRNPEVVENEFTMESEEVATEFMHDMGIFDLDKVKELVAGLDMTSVSTRELSVLGHAIYWMGYKFDDALSFVSQGNMDSGLDGMPRNQDVKFNAIALIQEQLENHSALLKDSFYRSDKGYVRIVDSVVNANHLVAALSYFAQTGQKKGIIDEQA